MYNDLRCIGGNTIHLKRKRGGKVESLLRITTWYCGICFVDDTPSRLFFIFSKLKWPWWKHVGFQWFWKVCDSPYDSQICESYDSHIWEFLRITQFYFLRIMRIIYSHVIRVFANHANHMIRTWFAFLRIIANHMIRMIRVFANHCESYDSHDSHLCESANHMIRIYLRIFLFAANLDSLRIIWFADLWL